MAMQPDWPTRKEFLMAMAGAALVPAVPPAQAAPAQGEPAGRKLLIVVAHPDDEYAFAASVYRLTREFGWTADELIVTDGESGYRYSALAEVYYGVPLTSAADARTRLPAIRKEEAVRAGKALGIRRHYFLEQRDLGFETNAAEADSSNWDKPLVRSRIAALLEREGYSAVFTLLPTALTHGHHRAATRLALEAAAAIPAPRRPVIFGAEPRAKTDPVLRFTGLQGDPLTATLDPSPVFTFDRAQRFGFRHALDYQIVVNWAVTEHKSQGLFQKEAGAHRYEQFWLFQASGEDALRRAAEMFMDYSAALSAR
jgi:LmbE family N-acetylglucosaminyl deacetylase